MSPKELAQQHIVSPALHLCPAVNQTDYRITATGSGWEGRTGYPRVIHRHVAVVDPVKERIYVFGGHDCSYARAEAYYYSPSSNSWHQVTIFHQNISINKNISIQISNLPWAAYDIAAAIVTQKNEERWLLVARSGHSDMYYWNLNTESGYHYMVTHYFCFRCCLTP